METILQQSVSENYIAQSEKPTFSKRFINWCTTQEKYRFGWLGAAVAGHGCVLTPITMFAIILGGNSIVFWMMATLVTNLAAMPTKITIPTFLLSIVIDAVIIASCVSAGFNISAAYN